MQSRGRNSDEERKPVEAGDTHPKAPKVPSINEADSVEEFLKVFQSVLQDVVNDIAVNVLIRVCQDIPESSHSCELPSQFGREQSFLLKNAKLSATVAGFRRFLKAIRASARSIVDCVAK
jgi:hypothetical protein